MSRTKRRKDPKGDFRWMFRECIPVDGTKYWSCLWVKLDRKSKECIKELAMYHSDVYRNHKNPGPAWFRNVFVERPQRRKAKRELQKFMLNEEYEVILNPKDPLEHWT